MTVLRNNETRYGFEFESKTRYALTPIYATTEENDGHDCACMGSIDTGSAHIIGFDNQLLVLKKTKNFIPKRGWYFVKGRQGRTVILWKILLNHNLQ